ncbi:hypothetical protein GCK72_019238 [Caenorhabditis remanei]|uniref:Uncharacterized protein n=1 Tax=Caenorhabditis remanei TaxID=31234 RepID=A0A6A5GDD3_CAERE|nr:hypothetical protein GCK72_019238 [Caenorhabditis remanei]KAF1752683.1 hypothetical protein GCK72_019238 [Caenorhabditis remanei]
MSIYWSDYIESSCRQNVSFFASSEFLMIAYHTTAIITIPLSVFTFCTIIRVTPNKMIKMKVPLLIALAWSTNLDLMLTINIAPFMFFPSAAGVSMGLLKSTGIPPKWLPYMGQVSVMSKFC